MTDLNLSGTVSNGTGTRAFLNPTYSNDDNPDSRALTNAYYNGSVVAETAILRTDLGSAQLVDGMGVWGSWNSGGAAIDPDWEVQYASSLSGPWTSVTGFSHSWDSSIPYSSMSFNGTTARYWRIVWAETFSGYSPNIYVVAWEIFAGTPPDPPDPPPDPEPGLGVDFDDTLDFVELADYVMSYRIERGSGPAITDGANPGRAVVTLQNPNDIFNPENTGGTYYGKLRDGLPMWIGPNSDGAFAGTAPRGLFAGRTANWTPILLPGVPVAPTVELTADDALSWYRRTRIRIEDGVGRSQQELRALMLIEADETRIELAPEIAHLPFSSWDGDLLSGLEAINRANGTRHYVHPENDRADWYTYTTRDRQWRLDATVDYSVDAGTHHVTGLTPMTLSADTVINQQKASATPIRFTPSSTVVWEAESLPWGIWHNFDKTVWVEFDDYVKDAVAAINYAGSAVSVTMTNYGTTAKLVLHYAAVGVGTVTALEVTGSLMRRGEDEAYVADGTASQTGTRGVRAGSDIGPQFVGAYANAVGIASHIVWRYEDPQLRPTLTIVNWTPYQFDIDLYDTIAVTIDEAKLVSRLFEVVGLTHECHFAPTGSLNIHTSTFVLQECRVQADPGWFVCDVSEADGTDILAY